MSEDNILAMIPGDLIARGSRTLPPPERYKGLVRAVEIDVPGQFRAKVLCKPFLRKRGKTKRWFWTAQSARVIL